MAVCYFNEDYKKNYKCNYEILNNEIIVHIDYEIHDEIRDENGVVTLYEDTKYNNRDIIIIDDKEKKNYLLKDAYYIKYFSSFGNPDGGTISSFKSDTYFEDSNYQKLFNLSKDSKINKIKVYTSLVNDFIGFPSVNKKSNEEELVISLKKESDKQIIDINENNVKRLLISDEWSSCISPKQKDIKIDLKGYIEIELIDTINYNEVWSYVWELNIFMQLLTPEKIVIDKVLVLMEDKYYQVHLPLKEIKFKENHVEPSVKEDITTFLQKCYKCIPYRESENEIRNIPYIVLNTSRNLEDNFLMFYRFIECYYKKQRKYNFIEYAINHNYNKDEIDDIEKLTSQIISLRNHYVHSGYFIKDKKLEINYKRIKGKKDKRDYIENDVNFEWIYKKTKILYDIVINIIFSNMLGYSDYKFSKHF